MYLFCSAQWPRILKSLYLTLSSNSFVFRPLASDQWSEFTFAPGATFVQLKIIVLRHWNILPGQLPLSVTSSKAQPNNNVLQTNSRTRSRPEWQAAETHIRRQTSHSSTSSREQALDGSRIEKRRVSLLSSSGTSSVGQTTYSQLQIESLHECARVIASYSFRSVCIGCFLPDEDVLARRCVDYDLLVVSFSCFAPVILDRSGHPH